MNSLLKPAVELTNILSFPQKLSVLVLLLLIPLCFFAGTSIIDSNQTIDRHRLQIKGIQFGMTVKVLAIDLAKHRGNLSQYLNGAVDLKPKIVKIEENIEQHFSDLETLLKKQNRILDISTTPNLSQIKANWSELTLTQVSTYPLGHFEKHSHLINDLFILMSAIADSTALTLQDSTHDDRMSALVMFKIPHFQESLGQLRGKSSGLIADGSMNTEEALIIRSLLSLTQNHHRTLKNEVSLLFKNAIYEEKLQALQMKTLQDVEHFLQSIENNLLAPVINNEPIGVDHNTVFSQGTQAIKSLSDFNHTSQNILVDKKSLELSSARWQRNVLFGSILSVILMAIYYSLGMLRSINVNIHDMIETLDKLKKGNFQERSNIYTNDNLNDMSKNLNQMIDSVSHVLLGVQKASEDMKNSAHGLETQSSSCHKEINTQNDQTELVATAASEMAASVKNVADSCSETANATRIANEAALKGKHIVGENINAINQLSDGVKETAQIIDHLKADVDKISGVVDVIQGISEQTNLLALNAAIEAARAGEQGRGFAVVADEVRSLAKRTQDSTAEIQSMIENLQRGSDKAVVITEQSQEYADLSVKRSDHAGQALLEIVDQADCLMRLNAEIAAATEEQSSVAEEISNNTQILSGSVHNLLSDVQHTAKASAEVQSSTASLEALIQTFRV